MKVSKLTLQIFRYKKTKDTSTKKTCLNKEYKPKIHSSCLQINIKKLLIQMQGMRQQILRPKQVRWVSMKQPLVNRSEMIYIRKTSAVSIISL